MYLPFKRLIGFLGVAPDIGGETSDSEELFKKRITSVWVTEGNLFM